MMSKRSDQMKLGAFLMPAGQHVAAWRHPEAQADAGVNLAHYVDVARTAERAGFDMIFLSDVQCAILDRENPLASPYATQLGAFEPITLLAAVAAQTERIGIVATATTTYYEPFLVARLFASLDLLSGGRAGWNLVTSAMSAEAMNFSREEHPAPDARYARAEEFADVVKGLWQSWEDDAFPRDKANGIFFRPDRLHVLNHRGPEFSVAGPLHVPRSRQGHPVIVQAGSSAPGKALAARTADVVFTAHPALAPAQAFYADVKGRLAAFGRSPDELKILPGVFPVVGATDAEALEKYEELQALILPEIALASLASLFNQPDLVDHPIDEPLPDWLKPDERVSRSVLLLDLARREGLTARQLHLRIASGRGHWTIHGSPQTIADQLETWFDGYAADGFNILPPTLPGGLDDFARHVVPELQRRGRFRTGYTGTTLREHLGLPFPTHPARLSRAQAAE